jgi:DNA-binding transcriptional regulator GbsR (MarR family)
VSADQDGGDGEGDALTRERALFVDTVGTEISTLWGNVTRLGGQCVAALYLADEPRSMDDLAEELGRSKSNVFANLRALEALGIVRRVRMAGSARDHFALTAKYPDVVVVAFVRKLGHVLRDKGTELGGIAKRMTKAHGDEDEIERIEQLAETYAASGELLAALLPPVGEEIQLANIISRIRPELLKKAARLLRARG